MITCVPGLPYSTAVGLDGTGGDWEVIVTLGAVEIVTFRAGLHNGEIEEGVGFVLLSALRGCNRSGDKARRRRGDPGSALLGLPKPFLLPEPGVESDVPGLYD